MKASKISLGNGQHLLATFQHRSNGLNNWVKCYLVTEKPILSIKKEIEISEWFDQTHNKLVEPVNLTEEIKELINQYWENEEKRREIQLNTVEALFTNPPYKSYKELFIRLKAEQHNSGFSPQTDEEFQMFENELKAKAFDIVLYNEQWVNFENPQKQFDAYVKSRFRIYEEIKNLPNCPIVKLKGKPYVNIDSGGTDPGDPKDYTGEFPAIIMTRKSEYWRGNSKRIWTYWHLAKSPDDIELILTQAEGDYLNNQEQENDFSFEAIYYFTHDED